ncbi:MAG TPA: class I SAM-dependent methyltransferase [Gaiella sp.]|jgi:SAM-dependent methyltransferase|nr:class I SAM-dependent methyltransferase [Gaiella sp.]
MAFDRDELLQRATSFGGVAGAYERARPGYPDDAVRWLAGEEPAEVVDLGAGTGKLTRSLVALGHHVTAIEPLPEMLAELQVAVPGAVALAGNAESIPLPDGSADVVTCAQAFHWFDHGPALAEIARVLRPGGRLGLVWNTRDERVGWVSELSELMVGRSKMGRRYPDVIDRSGLYHPVEHEDFDHSQELGRDALRELVLSRSDCAILPPDEREPILDRVDDMFDRHARDGVVRLPYVTVCFRAARH